MRAIFRRFPVISEAISGFSVVRCYTSNGTRDATDNVSDSVSSEKDMDSGSIKISAIFNHPSAILLKGWSMDAMFHVESVRIDATHNVCYIRISTWNNLTIRWIIVRNANCKCYMRSACRNCSIGSLAVCMGINRRELRGQKRCAEGGERSRRRKRRGGREWGGFSPFQPTMGSGERRSSPCVDIFAICGGYIWTPRQINKHD